MKKREGWHGWDEYAPFYDWENARTLGRRDVPFWRSLAKKAKGRVLELGCGTGRISLPLARAGVSLVGVDRSAPMLARLARGRRLRNLRLVRADIRALPFASGTFSMVLAPYGLVQSLLRDRDLTATLASVSRVVARGGLLGIDLVPDVPKWREYANKVQLEGKTPDGGHLKLVESVRQDRRKGLTHFEQVYHERKGRRTSTHRFNLTFRTVPIPLMTKRLERAGFRIEAVLGDYRGGAWDDRADVWIVLARRL